MKTSHAATALPAKIYGLNPVLFILMLGTGVLSLVFAADLFAGMMGIYKSLVPEEIRVYVWAAKQFLLTPYPWGALAAGFLLEYVRPARLHRDRFLSALAQDFLWFLTDAFILFTLVPFWAGLLRIFYDHSLSFLTVPAAATLPALVKVILAFLIYDFLQWAHHWVRHKVPVFWNFHAVHHSQRTMNLFTDSRIHPVEHLITHSLMFIPMFAFQVNPFSVVAVSMFRRWYQRIYHANLRTNFGPLRYILVTPQSHRIHHSIEERHRDRNFGVMFSVWDRLFGTHFPGENEYPETGVRGLRFSDGKKPGRGLIMGYLEQLVYPFYKLFDKAPSRILEKHEAANAV